MVLSGYLHAPAALPQGTNSMGDPVVPESLAHARNQTLIPWSSIRYSRYKYSPLPGFI
jgi:hypothetical protein